MQFWPGIVLRANWMVSPSSVELAQQNGLVRTNGQSQKKVFKVLSE